MNRSKKLAIFFSLVPGAGHMYLGLTTQGIQLMLLFFFMAFTSSIYGLGFFGIFLPVIWFYSVFDAWTKVSSDEPLTDSTLKIFSDIKSVEDITSTNSLWKLIGYVLLIAGILSLMNNLVLPLLREYFDYTIVNYFRSILVSAILIFGGFALLFKGKNKSHKEGEAKCTKEE